MWTPPANGVARSDDEETLDRVQRWTDEQQRLVDRDLSDPLDPSMTADRSGREVAAAIVAAVFRDLGGLARPVFLPVEPLGDVPLDRALVDLAAAILTLPPEPEPEPEPVAVGPQPA